MTQVSEAVLDAAIGSPVCPTCGKAKALAAIQCRSCSNRARKGVNRERDQKIVEAVLAGATVHQITTQYSITRARMYQILNEAGVQRPKQTPSQQITATIVLQKEEVETITKAKGTATASDAVKAIVQDFLAQTN